ncbi:methyl-accepting chemotaxis protein [Albimonas sp. CAU 1670]|uniref:methyl-accepting chemotaxis protein n=1 Tax=Albimonas sp. CAU 1670 TaxID=3032599 RepID=UPI0023DC2200|nr:methyl-accepting chemotaxis protein [Albimonas sp. CAU 1670]MDF2233985.1 methyl-accepting chemotaxis protein [Albimonas sp. CAU 1670]
MGNLRSRAALAAAAIVLFAVFAMSASIAVQTMERLAREAQAHQSLSLRAAAAIVAAETPGFEARFGADGQVQSLSWEGEPDLASHAVIDRVAAVTGETATVFALDPAQGEFVRRSTNIIKPDGQRAVGTVLGKAGPVHPVVASGRPYRGEATILGKDYYTVYFPIRGASGGVEGILYVGVEKAGVAGAMMGQMAGVLATAALTLLAAVALAWGLAGRATRPLAELTEAVGRLEAGDRATGIPAQDRSDEIGLLARRVESLRSVLARAEQESAQERARTEAACAAAARTLTELRDGVNAVVGAAVDGDFSRRVDVSFEAPELRELASGVNRLGESLSGFLGDLELTLTAMAKGDLSRPMEGRYGGRLARLADASRSSLGELAAAIAAMRDGAEGQRAELARVADAMRALSDRAESQASTIEETAATMTEMSETVAQSARNLTEAERMTETARQRARQGAESADKATGAMERIERSSAQVSDIISLIDSIAFQTNLLALNAAVEAARAGEAGKGFAVVASEVRTLAQRSSEAARDISELIKGSAAEVADGVSLVNATGASLAQIVESIDQLNTAIADAAAAGREQGQGVQELNSAVQHMDATVQENTRQTAEAAAAAAHVAEDVAAQARRLEAFVTARDPRRAAPRAA